MYAENQKMKITNVEVGMFKLPGVLLDKEEVTEELLQEINEWCEQNNCGKHMTGTLWSFKKEKQRDMFIIRWSS